ncbi:PP175 [Orf virus]|uniref:PP175 n=1 Tax=Orf virus TaxID=10258 RepID=F1AX10_ORFV|nr:PP175 [Orf virus]
MPPFRRTRAGKSCGCASRPRRWSSRSRVRSRPPCAAWRWSTAAACACAAPTTSCWGSSRGATTPRSTATRRCPRRACARARKSSRARAAASPSRPRTGAASRPTARCAWS